MSSGAENPKKLVLVAGMHRSGTSLITRLLNLHGAGLPPRIVSGDISNERGYWESRVVQEFNERLLYAGESSWFDDRKFVPLPQWSARLDGVRAEMAEFIRDCFDSHSGVIVIKDPRLCRLVGFWKEAAKAAGTSTVAIIPYRNPLEVVSSIMSRDTFSAEHCFRMWLRNVLDAERDTRGFSRFFCSYEEALADWRGTYRRLQKHLALGGLHEYADVKKEVDEFTDPDSHHWTFSDTDVERQLGAGSTVNQVYGLLKAASLDDSPALKRRFTACRKTFEGSGNLLAELAKRQDVGQGSDEELKELLQSQESTYREFKDRLGRLDRQLKEQRREWTDEAADLTQQLKATQERLNATEKQLEIRSAGVADLERAVKKKEGELSEVTHHLMKTQKVLAQERARAGEQEEELAQLQRQLERLETSHVAQQAEIEDTRNALSAERERSRRLHQDLANGRQREEYLGSQLQSLSALNEKTQTELAVLGAHAHELSSAQEAILGSLTWKLTSPLRFVAKYGVAAPLAIARSGLGRIFKRAKSGGREPVSLQDPHPLIQTEIASRHAVARISKSPPKSPAAQLIAFYLPQFHAIPENDTWWGEGFTEWTNVRTAEPQYAGHVQPREPGELGYYDLSDPGVMSRQVELARQYGLGGFCFYFYWFAGKRLLEQPVLDFLSNRDLDLPFCLCWANENWSRTWDGLDGQILIAQGHSAGDDLAFIEYLARYLRDDRYIHVDGKPLLVVYRPSLLPDPRKTAHRWRQWCRDNDIGEIFLAYTQSFEHTDPAAFGFDAAIEFPPNYTGPDIVTGELSTLTEDFSGIVYDWTSIAQRSRNYTEPSFRVFRGVNPAWDNTARRGHNGAIFAGSTPEKYGEWLRNAIEDTVRRAPYESDRLVFINAWNEWAEGAYLEPDRVHGYAWLQATREALETAARSNPEQKVVLAIHDALAHGAQYLTLYLARSLTRDFGMEVELVVFGDGVLLPEFECWAKVHKLAGLDQRGAEAVELAQDLARRGFRAAIANTTVAGQFLATLADAGLRCISLVHELRNIIDNYELHDHARTIAERAVKVVFAAQQVADSFSEVSGLDPARAVIRPQGLYKTNAWRKDVAGARVALRKELGLRKDALIVLGVGYLDHRKGVDLFVEAGLKAAATRPEVHLVWVGHWEEHMRRQVLHRLEGHSAAKNVIFTGRKDDTDLYYAGADVFVLSSREDPFPSTVMEALDVGVPVIAFREAGGSVTLLERGCGLLVPLGDTDQLADAILKLVQDPEHGRALGLAGQTIVRRELSFHHYVYDLLDLLGLSRQRVTAIVPNYNYARHLPQRLGSILEQTHPIFEIIVLDDASTDNSIDVIEEALADAAPDWRLVINEKNSGSVSRQWRKAVDMARGDLVWICEADDYALPEFLNQSVARFKDPGVVMSYTQSMQVGEDGNLLEENYLDYTRDVSETRWLEDYVCEGVEELAGSLAIKNTIPNVSAVLFRRHALAESMERCSALLEDLKIAGDWLIYSDLLERGRVAFIAESLNAHRRHLSSVTIDAENNARHYEEIRMMQKRISKRIGVGEDVAAKAEDFRRHATEYLGLA